MSYGGAGTEANPYIVNDTTTCSEFLELLEKSGAYIEMQADIDFSTDTQYRTGLTSTPLLRFRKLYANSTKQDGSKYGVNGLKITGGNFFNSDVDARDFENIQFVNCIYNNNSGNGGAIFNTASVYTDCVFSFVCNQYSYSKQLASYNQTFNRCSMYFIITGTSFDCSNITKYMFCTDCCIQIDGLIGYGYTYGYAAHAMIENMTRCTVLIDMTLPTPADGQSSYLQGAINFDYLSNCCIALAIHDGGSNPQGYVCSIYSWGYYHMSNTTILDKGIIVANNVPTPPETAELKLLTTTQMKSQSYLLSIGFLP